MGINGEALWRPRKWTHNFLTWPVETLHCTEQLKKTNFVLDTVFTFAKERYSILWFCMWEWPWETGGRAKRLSNGQMRQVSPQNMWEHGKHLRKDHVYFLGLYRWGREKCTFIRWNRASTPSFASCLDYLLRLTSILQLVSLQIGDGNEHFLQATDSI